MPVCISMSQGSFTKTFTGTKKRKKKKSFRFSLLLVLDLILSQFVLTSRPFQFKYLHRRRNDESTTLWLYRLSQNRRYEHETIRRGRKTSKHARLASSREVRRR